MSRINFSVARNFMYSILLGSVDDEDVEYWSKQVENYQRLLECQSIKFDTTKLAASRMRLLATVTNGSDGSNVNTEFWDREAFFRELR